MISNNVKRRVTVKLQCPNPLFEKWLSEWRDQAIETNSKTQHTYSLALQSLRKYPLPLERGKDCKILKGFGNKLCDRLDDKLRKHLAVGVIDNATGTEQYQSTSSKKRVAKNKQTKPQEAASSNQNDYVPNHKSGPYAILVTLYKSSLEANYLGFLNKKELIRAAQPFSDTSFTKVEAGSFYTAWNSMRTLISKNLVKKEGNPGRYSLTNEGIILGHKLYFQKVDKEEVLPACSSSSRVRINSNENLVELLSSNESLERLCSHEKIIEVESFQTGTDMEILQYPEPMPAISLELKSICGVYSNESEITKKPLSRVEKKTITHQDLILVPFSFDVILLVDTQETNGAQANPLDDPIIAELRNLNVQHEVKNLKVGDYCWICRDRQSGSELILPHIIERKRMDDLASSIKDGRFHEQKFRLKQCGLSNVIYMIETYGKKDEHVGLPLPSLYQATINTLVQDRFCVKFVEGVRGVAEYLSCMSNLLKKNYENKTVVSCPKESISDISIADDLVSLMFFTEFNKLSSKSKSFKVKDMFIKQLLQIKGLSIEKALAIVELYPTPQLLKQVLDENGIKSANIIANIKYGKLAKKVGAVLGNIIYQLYTKNSF